jgi:hypothetical protein
VDQNGVVYGDFLPQYLLFGATLFAAKTLRTLFPVYISGVYDGVWV